MGTSHKIVKPSGKKLFFSNYLLLVLTVVVTPTPVVPPPARMPSFAATVETNEFKIRFI